MAIPAHEAAYLCVLRFVFVADYFSTSSSISTKIDRVRVYAIFKRLGALLPTKKHSFSARAYQMHFIAYMRKRKMIPNLQQENPLCIVLHSNVAEAKATAFSISYSHSQHLLRHLVIPCTYWPLRKKRYSHVTTHTHEVRDTIEK